MGKFCVLFKRIVDPYLSITVFLSHMTKFVTIRWSISDGVSVSSKPTTPKPLSFSVTNKPYTIAYL